MAAQTPEQVHFASTNRSLYPYVLATFVAVLLISNIGATKLIEFGPIITDGGVFLFPLTYVIGDILSEVYGFTAARRAVFMGFAMAILAAFTFYLVQISPLPMATRIRMRSRPCSVSCPASCSRVSAVTS